MERVTVGVQSFTYRNFDISGMLRELQGTDITAVELWPRHLPGELSVETVKSVKAMFAGSGIEICGFGVFRPKGDAAVLREQFSLIRDLGARYISIDIPPQDTDRLRLAAEAAQEVGVLLGIHNHGPTHHYSKAEDVVAAIGDLPEALGACVDTGHYLRSGQTAEEAIRILGSRVHAVHLKDFVDEKTEVIPGTGRLDYTKALDALRRFTQFDNALVIEYEADPSDPTPAMKETVTILKAKLGLA